MLATYRYGPDEGRPLLIVHGLFGSARNWGVLAKRLSVDRPVLTVDMRNHGESFRAEAHGYEDMAEDLAQVIEENGGNVDLLGHSMGGKSAMMLALTRPEFVRRLIVADIAPVAYSHTQLHLVEAMQELEIEGLKKRSDADRALERTVPDSQTRSFLLQSLDVKAPTPRWKLNLDVLAEEMDKILGWPATDGRFDGPTLFLSGARSDYVLPDYRSDIKALFPAAQFAKIPDAGHWLHADRPREFEATVAAYLSA
ncbi:alpha/beta fold hydrolase [Tropicimonas isoalkanivorans]|uniref:Pimeloyl-ACP methyl ester carboxylesterase n=1 Tax=Tropicimonas isoalkanivorans TaxID=441112 RepID=A0A1I1IHY8_9RHOB|nr:alpha/beta fold hydrolase [Tropicimonas isoalkanivorans]SFC35571.1 Pimeloyl-ACP methyl ester carboxylesterase [Tropicimonas isoalkanivorans]